MRVRVVAVSGVRGPAPVARQLYEETPESVAARERAAEMRRLAPEPALGIEAGQPTAGPPADRPDARQVSPARGRD